jgi:NitT/TauT family transport system permease protein
MLAPARPAWTGSRAAMSDDAGSPPEAPRGSPSLPRRVGSLARIRGLIGVVAVLLAAEVLSITGVISRSALPPISTVLGQAVLLLGSTQFLGDLTATIEAWAAGLAITVAVGVPAGLVLGSVPGVRSATRAVVEFLRPIPPVALIPLVALVVGPGLRMNLTLIVYAAIWPVLFNTIYGLDDVDPVAKQTLRAFGFGRFDVIRRVCLPAAAPFIATGIRVASSIALIVSIAIGILTGRIDGNGIGAFISDANTAGSITPVLAAALWAGALGLAFNALLLWAERRVLPWHHAYLGETEAAK